MFDIGWTEILIIAVVAIIVVGPKDLPSMLRTLGRYAGQLRRTAGEFRSQFDDAIRDSELEELRSTLQETSDLNPINQIRDSITDSMAPLKESADDIKSSIEAPQSAGDDASKEPAPKKKTATKSRKSKPKKQTSAATSGSEG
jgi:sec-independent protein translocase protein TatB